VANRIADAKEKAKERQSEKAVEMINELAYSDPETVANWSMEEMRKTVPGAKATHHKYSQDIARANINNRTTMYDARWSEKTNEYIGQLHSGTPVYEVQKNILADKDLAPYEADKILKTILGAFKTKEATGVTPWSETINKPLRDQIAIDIGSGKITRLGEITELLTKDGKIQMSIPDYNTLVGLYRAKHGGSGTKYNKNDPDAAFIFDEIEREFRDDEDDVPEDRTEDYFRALQEANRMLSDPAIRNNPEKLNQDMRTMLKQTRNKEARKVVESPGLMARLFAGPERPVRPQRYGMWAPMTGQPIPELAPREQVGEGVATPKTVEDFESEVARLKGIDMEAAREYYEQWAGRF